MTHLLFALTIHATQLAIHLFMDVIDLGPDLHLGGLKLVLQFLDEGLTVAVGCQGLRR